MPDNQPATEPNPSPPAAVYDALGEAKRLLRDVRAGALATQDADHQPFVSLVTVATAADGAPLLLLSRLAAHTGHLDTDPRCSLLLTQTRKGDPLAHPRISIVGRARRLEQEGERAQARARFLARNPKAALYVDFPDFGFWTLDLAAVHLNGGFARAARFTGAEVLTDLAGCAPLLAAEADAVDHMNRDHTEALRLYATALARGKDGAWRASGIDPEGIDLICGDMSARVVFPNRVTDPGALRAVLRDLAEAARRRL
ncbi:HugZ family protein [Lichenihabitans psoromatis]|uniref:HugZ family pyridoxamine 5'-phosphate oxidase n=1 Tax=Lichenihabitans psoromatis TaxID=2528642 RepID=UPI0010384D97|nr:DUF2470 domain-containing protein [Lichenihabitans psoromatis]